MQYRMLLYVLMLGVVSSNLLSQNTEQEDYNTASSIQDQEKKSELLKIFIAQYPNGKYLGRALNSLFRIAVNNNQDSIALYYADQYLNTISEAARMNPYNSVAYTLAEKKIGLDSAAIYAQKAVDLAQSASKKALRQILDTQALVYFERGQADSALALEREAIIGNESDPSYLHYLSIYEEATGHTTDALTHAAQAVLYGDGGNAIKNFYGWLQKTKTTKAEQQKYKERIVDSIVNVYMNPQSLKSVTQNNSSAALFMAKMGVYLQRSETMASTSVDAIDDATPLDMMITLKTNLAIIQSELGKNAKALQGLLSIRSLVSPYDSEYWFTLGQLYEKQNDAEHAMESYVQGMIAYENPKVKTAADELLKTSSNNTMTISEHIAQAKELLIKFDPGKSISKNLTGRTVLAELFTGAECNPCVASDRAFDKLGEYYPRTDLAILEYHVHIPGPDPMTNPDTYKRYQFYGGNFGTPTVFIDGGEKLVGGGGSIVAANRFRVYEHLVSKYQKRIPVLAITGTAEIKNDIVKVTLTISSATTFKKDSLMIHIALAEKSIEYTGANGVDKHIFVVRDLAHGAEGTPLILGKKDAHHTVLINVDDIQNGVATYLDDPTKDPSWKGTFSGWKERTDSIDRSNLAIVAWVQNATTKEVMQSIYMDVTNKISIK